MPSIRTVTGDISGDQITFCQCHEHLMIQKGQSFLINNALCINNYDFSLAEIKSFKSNGGSTIVDAQPIGCGRMPIELLHLSKESGVQIISSTGFHKTIFYPNDHWLFSMDRSHLAALFTLELEEGLFIHCDTHIPHDHLQAKAGIIKTALDTCGLTGKYLRLFEAAAGASLETGAPIMVHIESGSDPLMLANFLKSNKVNLNKIIFCHMDRACTDISIHKKICEMGIYLEYDTIGRFQYHSDEHEAGIFKEMIHSGYEDRLLFSLDTTRSRMKSYTPSAVGLDYIQTSFIPLLKQQGVFDNQIEKIARENCIRVLSMDKQH